MLNELRHYENLGTPSYFFQLLGILHEKHDAQWTMEDVNQLFHNKIIDDRRIFDGCVQLAIKIGVLFSRDNYILIDNKLTHALSSEVQMKDRFIEYLFKALANDEDFHQIFNSKYLSYDVIYKSFQISNQAFGFRYSNFKQLLVDFEVIAYHPTPEINKFIINTRYKKVFDKEILPVIRKRRIGVEELRKTLEEQQISGEEAEKYVLEFERKRLNWKTSIEWVAEYVANQGFDIASYDNESDNNHNRFIEVKSYSGGKPYFYWSRNELLVAKSRQDSYWVYLVNRNEITNDTYCPLMVQNPYKNILGNNQWVKQIEKYKLELHE